MSEVFGVELPVFERWRNSFVPGMRSPSAYLEHETSVLSAMLVVELIFPELIEVGGCVLRADSHDPATFERWMAAFDGDRQQVERTVNAQPLALLFDPADEVEERALGTLAERVALGWRAQAALQFPGWPITVRVEDSADEGPTVLLYQRRQDGPPRTGFVPQVREFARHVEHATGKVRVRAGILRPALPGEIAGLS